MVREYGALPPVECVPSQINQVFMNLLLNAMGAIPDRGTIRIRTERDEELCVELARILQETTAGDPMSALRWTNQSTQSMAEELTRRGHPVSDKTVARCLRDGDYGLSLPAWHEQVEAGGTSTLLVHQLDLERAAALELRKRGEPVCRLRAYFLPFLTLVSLSSWAERRRSRRRTAER